MGLMARATRQPRWEDCTAKQQASFGELCSYLQQLTPQLQRRLAERGRQAKCEAPGQHRPELEQREG
ncbi:MAG: hypothetical protein L3J63_04195 [Geopsychrobacter sp.]|nr:hypothetical protein [Geopsychrobacter sp.]